MNYTLLSPNNKDFLLALSHLGSTRFYQGLQTAYDRFFNDFLSMHPSCPKCNHTAIVFYDVCSREVYLNHTYSFTLQISRVRCANCSCLSRILPDYVIPHKRYVVGLICLALDVTQSVRSVSNRTALSTKLIRYWRTQYKKWHEVGLQALMGHLPLEEYPVFLQSYKESYGYAFMQVLTAR